MHKKFKIKFFESIRFRMIAGLLILLIPICLGGIFAIGKVRDEIKLGGLVLDKNQAIDFTAFRVLSAAKSGELLAEKAFSLDKTSDIKDLHQLQEFFKEEEGVFNVLIKVLTWGSDSEAFRQASDGAIYAQWIKQGWQNKADIKEVTPEIKQYSGLADIYFSGLAKYARQSFEHIENYLTFVGDDNNPDALEQRNAAFNSLKKVREYQELLSKTMIKLIDATDHASDDARHKIAAAQNAELMTLAISIVIFFLWMIVVGWYFFKRILLDPLEYLINETQELGKGQFTRRISFKSNNELGRLADSFNQMTENLEKSTVSRSYVENILRSMSNMLIVANEKGEIITVNGAALKVLGYQEAELLGKPIVVLFERDQASVFSTEIGQDDVRNDEKNFITQNGQKIAVLLASSMMRDHEKFLGVVYVAQDITDRKSVEDKLRQQKEILSLIISNIPHHIFWKDKNLFYLGCNSNFAKVAGLNSPDEIIGKNDYDMPWKKEESDFFRKIDREVMEKGESILDIEEPQLQADGRQAVLLTSKVPLRDSVGKVFGILGIYADITERKKAEETIKKIAAENLHLAQAVNSVSEGILITDCTRPDNPIIYTNPAFTTITGYAFEDVIGSNCRILQGPDTDPKAAQEIREALLAKKGIKTTILNYRKDGTTFWNELSITPIFSKAGDMIYFVGVQTDVSERRRIDDEFKSANANLLNKEKALRNILFDLKKTHDDLKNTQGQLLQSEKLAAIGQLAAGVAHEINNPVGFISNNMEVFKDYIGNYTKILSGIENVKKCVIDGDIEQSKSAVGELKKLEDEIDLVFMASDINKLLDHSTRGLERIQKIVLDLRTFSRADTEEVLELVKIEDVIDGILNIVHSEIKYKAELIKNYSDTPLVKCNPQRLGQVFINLLVNAVQSMNEKGKIVVKTYHQGQHVCVEVADTGKGIPPENLKKIFDPFFTTKPVGQGTGLGLSVSYEIIAKHGGDIKVNSKVGEGTTFTIFLPLHK